MMITFHAKGLMVALGDAVESDVDGFTHCFEEFFEVSSIIDNYHSTETDLQEHFLHEESCKGVCMNVGAWDSDNELCHITHRI